MAAVTFLGGCGNDSDTNTTSPSSDADVTTTAAASTGGAGDRADVCEAVSSERVAAITGREVAVAKPEAYDEGPDRLVNVCFYRASGGQTTSGSVASIETLRFPSADAAQQDFASAYKSWQPVTGFGDEAAQLHTSEDQLVARFGSVHLRVSVTNLNREASRYPLAEQLMKAAAEVLQPTF